MHARSPYLAVTLALYAAAATDGHRRTGDTAADPGKGLFDMVRTQCSFNVSA
jgi:hypothetical protein